MKKLFLIPLMACFSCVMAFAVNVGTKAELVAALANGDDITLTANISSDVQLNISKATVIDGNGFAVKGTQQYVFKVGADATLKNLVIYAAKSKAGRGLLVDNNTNDIVLSLDNVTINATERGMDVWYSNNVTLNIKDSKIQLVPNGGAAQDATTGMPATDNYDVKTSSVSSGYSRGVNIGQLTNSSIVLENTTVQGFFYNLNNIGGTMLGSKVTASNCVFKGRAAFNIWGDDGEYVCNDCAVTGINNFAGAQESFASFVLNGNGTISKRNKLTINGGTIVSAYFDATGMANPNARQYLLRDLGEDNVIVLNNSSYTCTKEANEEGDAKGGVIEYASSSTDITINGGSYDCPSIIGGAISDGAGNTGSVVITGGDFNVNTVSPDMTDGDMYSTVDIQGGTYNIDLADLHAPGDESNGLISTENGVVINQNGTTSVVPAGTKDATSSATDPEIEWNDPDDWTVPTASSNVVIAANQTVTLEGAAGAAYRLDMGEGAKLIVKEGTTLTIGKGGVALNNNNDEKIPQIIIEKGAQVITYGLMYNSVAEDLIIQASEAEQGVLLIDPNAQAYGDNHPMGTVELVSKAYKRGEDDFVFQRFGVPAYMQGVKRSDMHYDHLAAPTAVWKLDYTNNTWADMADEDEFIPFRCYELTTTATTPGTVYTFTCPLMGNSNAELELNGEWNYYANSYTAPIDVKELIASFADNYEHMSATVYLYRASDNWWYELNDMAYLFDNTLPTKIDPMQAFIFQKRVNGANPVINYVDNVWDPIVNPSAPAGGAPARNRESYNKAMIEITAADGTKDAIRLVENGKFSAAFDNSYDAAKYMNENSFNLFVDANDEKLGSVATDDLNGMTISMTTKGQTSFTMTISHVSGMNYAVRDMLTGTEIDMIEGATYMFSVPADANVEGRFQIIEKANAPTAIDNIEATAAVKGIYTITGQFVGNDYHSLPNGIYVVDGKKIVK